MPASQPMVKPEHEFFATQRARGIPVRQIERSLQINHSTAMDWSNPETRIGGMISKRANYLRETLADKVMINQSMVLMDMIATAWEARQNRQFNAAAKIYSELLSYCRENGEETLDAFGKAVEAMSGDDAARQLGGIRHGQEREGGQADDAPDTPELGTGDSEGDLDGGG